MVENTLFLLFSHFLFKHFVNCLHIFWKFQQEIPGGVCIHPIMETQTDSTVADVFLSQ